MSNKENAVFPSLSENYDRKIENYRKIVDFDVKEYPIEVIAAKYSNIDAGADRPEFFIPDYQREHTWDKRRQSKFIESILIGLPIPFLTFAEVISEEGELEIVDGSQRVRTLVSYLKNELCLEGLEKLSILNATHFSDLSLMRQRKFKRATIRIIVLSSEADEETRRDIFERINTGSDPLSDMEQRRGIMRGSFISFIEECAQDKYFIELAKISAASIKRREKEEFVLRFFAYLNNYLNFEKSVKEFLDIYTKEVQITWNESKKMSDDKLKMKKEFISMLKFVKKYFPNGFCRSRRNTVPRIRFEAISVGVALALRSNPKLTPTGIDKWVESENFLELTTSDASNSRPKVQARIEFVRDMLLNN